MKQRLRTARWVVLALVVIVAVAAVSTYLTAPRPGGAMDPEATSPKGPAPWSPCCATTASR